MKKLLVLLSLMLCSLSLFALGFKGDLTFAPALSLNTYAEAKGMKAGLSKNVCLGLGDDRFSFGLVGGVGFSHYAYDVTRFACVSNAYYVEAGLKLSSVVSSTEFSVSISPRVRNNYLFAENSWYSQVGGEVALRYQMREHFFVELPVSYYWGGSYRSYGVSLALGVNR